jgi:hypothetical protein
VYRTDLLCQFCVEEQKLISIGRRGDGHQSHVIFLLLLISLVGLVGGRLLMSNCSIFLLISANIDTVS